MTDFAEQLATEEGVEIAPGVRVRLRSLADYRQNPENPVAHTSRNLGAVIESIHKVGAARSGLASKGKILAGNLTWEAMATAGIEGIVEVTTDGNQWVMVNREDLSPEQEKQAAYGDQQGSFLAGWELDQVLADAEAGVDLDGLLTDFELEAILGEALVELEDRSELAEKEARQTLAQRFIVPPFSILDARQGYWQERKRAWIALGIRGELGRGEATAPGGSLRDAANLGFNGKTVRGDGKGRPIAERERE